MMDRVSQEGEVTRLDVLERRVAELTDELSRLRPREESARRARARRVLHERRAVLWAFRGEQWTGRVGLALLFLGLVFLFQYSVEQGWITPPVRVLFGAGVGATLLVTGLRAAQRRPSYGAILLAGSIASFYATGWAASYLYGLVNRPLAFVWMAAVMALAFGLARRQERSALASLGAMGGFATPFLLTPGSETPPELVAYTTLVVLWSAALYLKRGWRPVLWTYLIGGPLVLATVAGTAEGTERILLQLALAVVWVTGAALPFLREGDRTGENPHPRAFIPFALELRVLGVGGTALVLAVTRQAWGLGDGGSGVLFLTAALAYAAYAWSGTRAPDFVARSAAPVAAALLVTATYLLFPAGALRWWAIAVQSTLFVVGGRTDRFRGLEWVAHGGFLVIAVAYVGHFASDGSEYFSSLATSFLAAFALAAAAAVLLPDRRVRTAYRLSAHLLILAWLAREFGSLSATGEWVTVAWAAYGGILLLGTVEAGRHAERHHLQAQGIAGSALALAVAKLLLVDMAQVSPLVRIPLFLGCGFALLALSAAFQRSPALRHAAPPRTNGRS